MASSGSANLIEHYFADDVAGFLADHGLTIHDIGSRVFYPGGPKVLEAINAALGLDDNPSGNRHGVHAVIGNLSSASVLHILRDAPATT